MNMCGHEMAWMPTQALKFVGGGLRSLKCRPHALRQASYPKTCLIYTEAVQNPTCCRQLRHRIAHNVVCVARGCTLSSHVLSLIHHYSRCTTRRWSMTGACGRPLRRVCSTPSYPHTERSACLSSCGEWHTSNTEAATMTCDRDGMFK